VLQFREEGPPGLASVIAGKDTAVLIGGLAHPAPGAEVEAQRIAWVNLQSGWPGHASRERDALPVFRLVRRAVNRSSSRQ
jgi:hypothetical protein